MNAPRLEDGALERLAESIEALIAEAELNMAAHQGEVDSARAKLEKETAKYNSLVRILDLIRESLKRDCRM